MTKQETYDYLNSLGIDYEVTEHTAVFNMEELDAVELPYPDCDAKNLFVRDDKKRNYYLITVKGDKRVGSFACFACICHSRLNDLDRAIT